MLPPSPAPLSPRSLAPAFLRWGFRQFYHRFAFTYDLVSAVVSRGEWRQWTHAGIPFLEGTRILELAVGPGNLHLSLWQRGCQPIGLDLSPDMIRITGAKFRRAGLVPRLVRGRTQALPFAAQSFDSVLVTFPPGPLLPDVLAEIARVLAPSGRLVWVDGGRLKPTDAWNRLLNAALDFTSGVSSRGVNRDKSSSEEQSNELYNWHTHLVDLPRSTILVLVAKLF